MLLILVAFFLNFVSANEYCKLCNGTHTMCLFKEGPAETCVNYTKITLTPGEKRYILDIHNDIRNHVASGHESRGVLGNQPSAADMYLLEWNDELAEIAQRWVDQCISVNASIQHDKCRQTESFDVGQNIVTVLANDVELPELSLLILTWYKQIMHVIPSDVDEFVGIWRGKYLIGQYTQLVWAKTKFVGCAVAAFKETVDDLQYNIRFVCNYGPSGNVYGQPVYERGKPCSRCPQKACDKLRPNLCSGGKKAIDIEKHKNMIYKKYKNKNIPNEDLNMVVIIDIDETTKNFSNPILSNTTNMSQLSEYVTNKYLSNEFGLDIDKWYNATSETSINILNTNEWNSTEIGTVFQNASLTVNNKTDRLEEFTNYATSEKMLNVTLENYSVNYRNGIMENSSLYPISDESEKNLQDIMGILFNTSGAFNFSKNVEYAILLINNFFNQTINSNLENITKERADEKLIIDLTNNKCDNKVMLDNNVILIQDCSDEYKNTDLPRRRFNYTSRRTIDEVIVRGDHIILPGNRHFKRATGIWHRDHCRCVRTHRNVQTSKSTNNKAIYFFYIIHCLVHFLVIY